MPTVRYKANANKSENTGAITFADERDDLVLGGVGDLTDEEFALLSQTLVLELVDSDGKPVGDSSSSSSSSSSASSGSGSTPSGSGAGSTSSSGSSGSGS